jgi:hypothetical protein
VGNIHPPDLWVWIIFNVGSFTALYLRTVKVKDVDGKEQRGATYGNEDGLVISVILFGLLVSSGWSKIEG